jgi:hypothetical protein
VIFHELLVISSNYIYITPCPCREDGNGPLKCTWAHEKFNFSILDVEFTLALKDLPVLITKVKDIIRKVPGVFPSQGILMRFSSASDTFMSPSYGRDSVHFEYYVGNRKDLHNAPSAGLAAYQAISQVIVSVYNNLRSS